MNDKRIAQLLKKMDDLQAEMEARIGEIRQELVSELVRANRLEEYSNRNDYGDRLLQVIKEIENRTEGEQCSALVGMIADAFNATWDDKITSHKVGKILRGMGVEGSRTRDGFLVSWKKGEFRQNLS